jgi:hypothetical protein
MRRVGRNTTKQFYCVVDKENCCFFENGRVKLGVTWKDKNNKHAVETDYFLKLYFHSKKTLEELIGLCEMIYRNPEFGYERKQPHAITNGYVKNMISKWQNKQTDNKVHGDC